MIIKTVEELRIYLPTHAMDNLDAMMGFFDNSEHDFLLEKVGKPLLNEIQKQYDALEDVLILLPQNASKQNEWHKLIVLCQRAVVFDAFMRAADISAVSVNNSGINAVSSGDYDVADKDALSRYKSRCSIEAHSAINRLLVQLEEWAQESLFPTPEQPDETPESPAESLAEETTEAVEDTTTNVENYKTTIVDLWRKSRYYYLADGLFINTASRFNEYIDIYESREKFIQLLPDLRYCQELMLRPELGDDLTDDLVEKMQTGTANTSQSAVIKKLQRTLALFVEARNKMFKRPEAKDEAIMNLRLAVAYIQAHQSDFGEAIKTSPIYQAPKEETKPEDDTSEYAAPPMIGCADGRPKKNPAEPWKNNRSGNAIFITPSIE